MTEPWPGAAPSLCFACDNAIAVRFWARGRRRTLGYCGSCQPLAGGWRDGPFPLEAADAWRVQSS